MKRDGDIDIPDGLVNEAPEGAPTIARSNQEDRVAALLDERDALADTGAFLARLLSLLLEEPALEDGTLARVALVLDGEDGEHGPAIARFWADLSARFGDHALVAAYHGNALLREGRDQEAMERVAAAIELDPLAVAEIDDTAREIARSLGGALWVRYQLAELRLALAAVEAAAEDRALGRTMDDADAEADVEVDEPLFDADDEDAGEEVRERYSELLDEYGDDPAALEQIRELGTIIAALERDGILPQCLIRRGTSRRF